jgi:predicted dehydrogenase
MTLRVGMIGLGAIHRAHILGYERARGEASLVAVCDSDGAKASAVAANLGAKSYTNYLELFDSGEIDAVDILLPHHLHVDAVTAAIGAGLHVLVEKPAAPTAKAISELEALARARNVVLAVAENTRFVEAYGAVHRILEAGTLGTVEVVRTMVCGNATVRLRTVTDWKGRRDGTLGGVIYDSGAHSFYLLEWLFGGVTELRAIGAKRVAESEVEDFAVVVGKLGGGGEFLTEYTFTAEIPWSERLEVYGSSGSVIVDQLADPVVKIFGSGKDWTGHSDPTVPFAPDKWKMNSIAEEVLDFVRAVNGHRPHAVSLEHIKVTMSVVEAAYKSMESGSSLVNIPRES